MKVLHLPHNIGSKITLTVAALRNAGVDAKGIAVNNYLDEAGEDVFVFNPRDHRMFNPRKLVVYWKAKREMSKWIEWADIVHWYYAPRILRTEKFLQRVKELNKPAVVEWAGSEVRIPDILSSHNPYYKKAFDSDYPYRFESRENARLVQQKFKDAGFEPLVRPELEEFVQKDIFPAYHAINNRVDVKKYTPAFPAIENKKLLLVHPVSSRSAKGTSFLLDAVAALKKKYDLDLLLIEHTEHEELCKLLSRADIVIDQLILGAFGTTTLEGMASGKPVVCYINGALKAKLPAACPIVNANPDTIYNVLETLVKDAQLRHETGKRSRAYVEQYHDAGKIAAHLISIYEQVIRAKNKK